jgi:oligo-alginate lyase
MIIKIIRLVAFVLVITCFASGVAVAKDKVTTKAHPYLFYTKSRVEHLKERMKSDTMMNRVWNEMKSNIDKSIESGKPASIEELSFAYRMTGDKKYAEAAKKGLVQLTNRIAWDGMDDRTPRWNSGLATGHNNYSAAVTFDAIYDYLTPNERKDIAAKIVKLGIEPSLSDWISEDKRLHAINSMGHNWWSAIVFEAGVASLAVMNEEPDAREWAENVMNSSKEWFAFSGSVLENKIPTFDKDGGFYESVSYANFGVSEYLLFRLAWTNAIAPIKMPYDDVLQKTMDWFINACYPATNSLMSLNFGDSNPFANGDRPVKLMIALGYPKDEYYWYLNQTKKKHVKEDMSINTPLGLLYQPDKTASASVPNLPNSAIYKDMGWAMLRSSWKNDATMLGVKSGYTWNHSHADAGSYVLYHKGKNLLIDGGDCNYGFPEYPGYFVRSEAHNVMMFNGKAQEPQDEYNAIKNVGHLYNLIDGGNFKYVLADATGPTSRYFLRNYRNFVWVGDVILVIDDVKSYEPGKFEWLLHFDQEAKKKGIDIEVTNDSAQVLVRPLFPETLPNGYPHDFPEKLRMEEKTGIKDRDPKTKIPYYSFSPAETSRQEKFITAIILLDDESKAVEGLVGSSGATAPSSRTNIPKVEKLRGNDFVGVRITQNGEVTDVYYNLLADGRLMHRNSNATINGWETDAYIMAVSYREGSDAGNLNNINRYFVSNGSYIRKDGKVVLHSLSKVFMDAEVSDNNPKVVLQGHPIINAKLRLERMPQQLLLNNNRVKANYSSSDKTVTLAVNDK